MTGNLWQDSTAETFLAPPLNGDLTVDLAIVGGGYTGLSAALRAAELGASAAVFEAHSVGHGGSGRNVGLVNAGLWLPPEALAREMGAAPAARLTQALGQGPDRVFQLIAQHGIACEPVRAGTLHCAHAPRGMADLRERHRQLAATGAPVTLLDAHEARRRTGTEMVHGALHDARAGTLQPLAYARGLARAAQDRGAKIYENTKVSEVSRNHETWQLRANGHLCRARALLIATNAYHVPPSGAPPQPVAILNFFQIATRPLSSNLSAQILRGGEGCWDTGTIMTSFRRDAAGRVILGGMGAPDSPGGGLHRNWARRKLAQMFPALADHPNDHLWQGRIAVTQDHVPKVLSFGPNAVAIFGYSGRGIAPGTMFGQAAADVLIGHDTGAWPVAPIHRYKDRATILRSAMFELGARVAHLR